MIRSKNTKCVLQHQKKNHALKYKVKHQMKHKKQETKQDGFVLLLIYLNLYYVFNLNLYQLKGARHLKFRQNKFRQFKFYYIIIYSFVINKSLLKLFF